MYGQPSYGLPETVKKPVFIGRRNGAPTQGNDICTICRGAVPAPVLLFLNNQTFFNKLGAAVIWAAFSIDFSPSA